MLGRSRLADSALDMPATDTATLIASGQTGDLWLSPGRPGNLAHFLLRLLTRSHWAHIGMLLRQDEEVFLIDVTLSHGLRILPIDQAIALEQTEGWSVAPVVLARSAALAGGGLPGSLSDSDAVAARDAILRRVAEGFPLEYDAREILRILGILLRGGLVRRWHALRHRPFMRRALQGHLAGLVKSRAAALRLASTSASAGIRTHSGSSSRWLWNKLQTAPAQARRAAGEDPYTCVELVAELLDQVAPYRGWFRLNPGEDEFLCPATVAEEVPLAVLGRLL